MEKDSKFTRDEEGYVAIRTVSAPYSSGTDDKDSMFTRDEDGYVAVRTITGAGGGGGDQHNLGYYATPEALEEAHPTAEAGDWAIVGTTDTVWIWDTDNNEWVDSDQKGQVTSVNNMTGAVTLGINDVAPTQTDKSGYVLGTDGFVAGWIKPEIVQRSAMPQASEDEEGNIYQFVGTTDANYTNGYFYKCEGAGSPVVYSWTRVDVQPTPNALQNTATGSNSLGILGVSGATRSTVIGDGAGRSNNLYNDSVFIGTNAGATGRATAESVFIGSSSGPNSNVAANYSVAVGGYCRVNASHSIAIGAETTVSADNAIQLNAGNSGTTNSDASTFKVANANGNFEMMSADGTIPTARLTKVNTTITLVAANWSSNSQTVNVTGMTADGIVYPCPVAADQADYTSAGILCSAQAAGTLTFTCDTTPTSDIDVVVVML